MSVEILNEDDPINLETYRLFLDLSSTCTGYVVAKITKGGSDMLSDATCEIVRAGALWFPDSYTNTQKYYYMYKMICEDFYITSAISDIIYERYSFSMNQRNGSLVVPEMIGAIKVASQDVASLPMGIEDIPPQTWRSSIGLVADTELLYDKQGRKILTKSGNHKVSRDWKAPCVRRYREMFGEKIPEKLISNVTGKPRAVPHDTFDALGICEGWHRKIGIEKFELADLAFNVGVIGLLD